MLTDTLRRAVTADPGKTAIVQGSRRICCRELDGLGPAIDSPTANASTAIRNSSMCRCNCCCRT
jgi:hypothetical protein